MRLDFVLGVVAVKRSVKMCKQTRGDIETSMLKATMQALIKETLRWINATNNRNSKLLNFTFYKKDALNEMNLTTHVADFKLLSKTQSNYIDMQKSYLYMTILH